MTTTIEETAAHEAGHCVVALATGVELKGISVTHGSHPESFLVNADKTFATEYVIETMYGLETRLTYLIVVGGFAGETILSGAIEPRGAVDDLTRLRKAGLSDFLIQGFTGIAIDILNDNIILWNEIRAAAVRGINAGESIAVDGPAMQELFNQVGKKFTDFQKLEAVLPLSEM